MSVKNQIALELAGIQQANGGLLRPADIVEFARNPDTTLHTQFDWDDTEAAEKWRLWQARHVIRLHVTVISEASEPVRAFVSLSTDRKAGGGYRTLAQVMADDDEREQLINDALLELNRAKRKYRAIQKLAPVWAALESVTVEVEKKSA